MQGQFTGKPVNRKVLPKRSMIPVKVGETSSGGNPEPNL